MDKTPSCDDNLIQDLVEVDELLGGQFEDTAVQPKLDAMSAAYIALTEQRGSRMIDGKPISMAKAAEILANHLHLGQVDKGGHPYIEHLRAVVTILLRRWPDAPDYVIAAAWLHDALVDTLADANDLEALGVSLETIDIVLQLTRAPWMPYMEWIAMLAQDADQWAVRAKIADNEYNSNSPHALPGSNMVETRYRPARAILEAAVTGGGES